jgi:hypothetical protein
MKASGFNHLPAVIRALPSAGHDIVDKICQDIAAGAGATAPRDTGVLVASYRAEVNDLSGIAGSNIEYAPYVEFGTLHGPAQPHLVPSADRVAHALTGSSSIGIKMVGRDIEEAARHG